MKIEVLKKKTMVLRSQIAQGETEDGHKFDVGYCVGSGNLVLYYRQRYAN